MRTESNIKPSARLSIEAYPPKEGAACTVVLFANITGPFERPAIMEGADPETYYEYDRYEVATTYRENLAQTVEASFDQWVQKAKEAEEAGEQPTEIEILQDRIEKLQKENKEMSDTIDDLIIASLGGDDFV